MRNILAIGAYERDNFGDELFLLLLRKWLSDDNIVAGSLINADMTSIYGETIVGYDVLLRAKRWDAVWVVGGEVGGVDIPFGLSMSLPETINNIAYSRDAGVLMGAPNQEAAAYIPELKHYPLNSNVALVVNSVGLSNAKNVNSPPVRSMLRSLRRTVSVTVRDEKSFAYCTQHGIKAVLAPDIVHTISLKYNLKKSVKNKRKKIIFQANQYTVNAWGVEGIAAALVEIAERYDSEVILFVAGLANGHDSIKLYKNIQSVMKKRNSAIKVEITDQRDPVRLAGIIANARLWIGTSLHGRIIAAAYEVARVSIENEKTGHYAQYWDSTFPYNVGLAELKTSVEEALSVNPASLKAIAASLTNQAEESMRRAINKLPKAIQSQKVFATHFITGEVVRQQLQSVEAIFKRMREREGALEHEVMALKKNLGEANENTKAIADLYEKLAHSKSLKLGRAISSPVRVATIMAMMLLKPEMRQLKNPTPDGSSDSFNGPGKV